MKPYKLRKMCFDCKDSVSHATGTRFGFRVSLRTAGLAQRLSVIWTVKQF